MHDFDLGKNEFSQIERGFLTWDYNRNSGFICLFTSVCGLEAWLRGKVLVWLMWGQRFHLRTFRERGNSKPQETQSRSYPDLFRIVIPSPWSPLGAKAIELWGTPRLGNQFLLANRPRSERNSALIRDKDRCTARRSRDTMKLRTGRDICLRSLVWFPGGSVLLGGL